MKAPLPAVRFVRTPSEMREVGQFRYAVYVQEMGRPQHDANHDAQTVFDTLDAGAFVLAAWHEGRVVGTCRVNCCGLSDIGPYESWYQAADVAKGDWPNATAILTRLMVAPEFRGTLLPSKLAAEAFLLGRNRGIGCALMDCNDHLLEFFGKIGWVAVGEFDHPDYGTVHTHRFDLRDHAHLERIRSPFLRVLRSAERDGRYSAAKPISRYTLLRASGGGPAALRHYALEGRTAAAA